LIRLLYPIVSIRELSSGESRVLFIFGQRAPSTIRGR
jgi:hypothetical protein